MIPTHPDSSRPVQTLLRLTQTEPRSTPIFKSGRVGEPNRDSVTGAYSEFRLLVTSLIVWVRMVPLMLVVFLVNFLCRILTIDWQRGTR
jgi:hypothetical protein